VGEKSYSKSKRESPGGRPNNERGSSSRNNVSSAKNRSSLSKKETEPKGAQKCVVKEKQKKTLFTSTRPRQDIACN